MHTTTTSKKRKYDLHIGCFGNGEVIYDVAWKGPGDYPTIAHISDNGEITYYSKDLPSDVVAWVEKEAKSLASQKVKWYHR